MKKKVLLMTTIGLVLLGAVIGVALNAIFTVTDVVVNYSVLSDTGEGESAALQTRLDETFVGKSTTFLKLEEVEATVSKFPGFELVEARKEFPRKIVLTVKERSEAFSFMKDGIYSVLDDNGLYLYDNEDNYNRRSGENILLRGFDITVSESGKSPEGNAYLQAAFDVGSVFLEQLEDARANVVSITLMNTGLDTVGKYFFRIQMCEGVFIDIYGPQNSPKEKAADALKTYLALSDEQRLYGFFDIIDRADGGYTVSAHRAEVPKGDEN